MKPSLAEAKRVQALEAQAAEIKAMREYLARIEAKLDAALAGKAPDKEAPKQPAPDSAGTTAPKGAKPK